MVTFANSVTWALTVASKRHGAWKDVAEDRLSAAPVGPDLPVAWPLQGFPAFWLLL